MKIDSVFESWFTLVDKIAPEDPDEVFEYSVWQRGDTRLMLLLVPFWAAMLGVIVFISSY